MSKIKKLFFNLLILAIAFFILSNISKEYLFCQENKFKKVQYANTTDKDFDADAPWRVRSPETKIPFIITIKDANDNNCTLQYISISRINENNQKIQIHLYGPELWLEINEDRYEYIYEGKNANDLNIPMNTSVLFEVEIGYDEGFYPVLPLYTFTKRLQVFIGEDKFPTLPNWYHGDTHYHSEITDNKYEFGASVKAIAKATSAMGLDWITLTDHSCDFDKGGDDYLQLLQLINQNNLSSSCRLILGEEVTLDNDNDNLNSHAYPLPIYDYKTNSDHKIHLLVYDNNFIEGPENPAAHTDHTSDNLTKLNEALNQLTNGFAYAAHPTTDRDPWYKWTDLASQGYFIGNLMPWSQENYTVAKNNDRFVGLEIWNERYSYEKNVDDKDINPFPWNNDPNDLKFEEYKSKLEQGINKWVTYLYESLATSKKIFLSGGSDAHGDLNYRTYLPISSDIVNGITANDNAISKVRTAVYCPNGLGNNNDNIMYALQNGHTVVTDGPMMIFGIDMNGDQALNIEDDIFIGEDEAATVSNLQQKSFIFEWEWSNEFGGQIVSADLITLSTNNNYEPYDLIENGDLNLVQNVGIGIVPISEIPVIIEANTTICFRLEVKTNTGENGQFRCYTNPIWIKITDNQSPIAYIDTPNSNKNIVLGESIYFSGHGEDNVGISSYSWNFDGGAPSSNQQTPGNIQFNTAGTYNVTFNVQDNQGSWDPNPPSRTIFVNQPDINNAKFIADVTIPDNSILTIGNNFTKTWRIQNTGSITWSSGYTWSFDSGSQMGAPSTVNLPNTVQPGEMVDISVAMNTPSSSGSYTGYWKMKDPSGEKFGERCWVKIIARLPVAYSCQLYAQNPANEFTMRQNDYLQVEVNYKNTGTSCVWENTGGVSNLAYIELRSCDASGNEIESKLYEPETWINRKRMGSYIQEQQGVAPSQVSRFVFRIKANGNLMSPGIHDVYFRPYHASGGWLDDWGQMHFRVNILQENPSTTISLISPNGGEILVGNTQHTIMWNTSNNENIHHIKLELSVNGGDSYLPLVSELLNTGNYLWTVPDANMLCKMKVLAVDASDNVIASDVSNETFNLVDEQSSNILTAPNLNAINNLTGSYTVSWNPVDGAQSYVLQEDENNIFSSPQEYATNDLDYFVSNKPNGTYYYQICGVNQYGRGEWSNIESATVTVDHFPDKPQVVSPTDDATNLPLSVTLQWSCTHPDGKALNYNVNFTTTNTENYYTNNEVSINQTETSYTISNLPYNTTCSWAIKAIDPDGDCNYSDMFHFTTIGDNTAPTGSITINNGAATTESYIVELNLAATDGGAGVRDMRLSNDGQSWTSWYGFIETYSWNLASSNYGGVYGRLNYIVYVQFRDYEQNVSSMYNDSIEKIEGSPGDIILNNQIYASIYDAIERSVAGDIVYLTPGFYDIPSQFSPPGYPDEYVGIVMRENVILKGAGADRTTIYSYGGSYLAVTDANNSIVEGIEIISLGPSYRAFSQNSILKDCIIRSNAGESIIVDELAQNITIMNCIVENGSRGIRFGDKSVRLFNNIFRNFSNQAIFGNAPLSFEIKNNIIINNKSGIRIANANPDNIRNNDVWNNTYNYSLDNLPGTDLTGINGNISSDPRLNTDYSLQSSSPCINAGTYIGIPYSGSAPDIGVKEYAAFGSLQVNSNHPGCSFTISGPQDYAGIGVNWTAANVPIGIYYASFTGIEGHYTPQYQTIDLKHGETGIFNGNYIPDQIGPTGSIALNYYEHATSDSIVSIVLDFQDDVAGIDASSQMRFSNNASQWSVVESYSTLKNDWSLFNYGGNRNEGEKIVYAIVSDNLSNWSNIISDTILYKPSRSILMVPEQYISIQEAINATQDGDIVWVGPGSYSGEITLKAGIELRGSGEGLTHFSGNSKILTANNTLISGIEGSFYIDSNKEFIIAENNIGKGSWFCSLYGYGKGILRNNLLNYPTRSYQGFNLSNQSTISFQNNTMNNTGQGGAFLVNHFEQSFLTNNIFTNNGTAIFDQNSDREHKIIVSLFNTFWGNDENCGGWSSGNEHFGESDIETNPLYIDPNNSNFTLQSGSSCINSGDPRKRYNDCNGSRNDRGYTGGPCFNTSPVADFSFDPLVGSVGTYIIFDANLSSDQQSDINHLWIRWDWENDGVWDTPFSLEKTIIHQFSSAGNKTVALQIRDEDFFIGSTTKQITIGNQPPNIPTNPVPNDNSTNIPTSVTIQWEGGDPNGNGSVLYDVYFGTLSSPPLAVSDYAANLFEIETLIYNQFYFWKVVAKDNEGATTIGPIWHFSTTGEPLPTNPSNLTIQEPSSAELQINWTDASDNEIGFKLGRKLEGQTDFTQIAVVQSDQTSYTDKYGLLGDSTYVYAVKAYNTSGNTGYSNEGLVIAPRVSYYDFPISDGGWYMVSLLLNPFNHDVSELFPTALGGNAFVWNDGSYSQTSTVNPQNGFWLPVPDSWFGDIAGYGVYEYTIHFVQPGWYMIGGVVNLVDFTNPNDSPDGSIITPAYGYNPYSKNYYATNTIDPKQGFWVAVLQTCDLNIGGEPYQQAMQTTFSTKMSKGSFFANYGETPPLPPKINWETGEIIEMPKEFCLYQNYPNPFNPSTTLSFDIPRETKVKIVVINLMGQQVRELTNKNYSIGNHNLIWDGKNDSGQLVSSGIYLVKMISGDFVNLKKLVLVR